MDVCQLCSRTKDDHEGAHHPFTPFGVDADLSFLDPKKDRKNKDRAAAPATAVGRGLGGDPALRLALINAGVITPVQLMAAEQELEDARSSGRPAISSAPAAGHPEDSPTDPRFGLGEGVRSGDGGGS